MGKSTVRFCYSSKILSSWYVPHVVKGCLPEQCGICSIEFKLSNILYISSGNKDGTLNVAVCGKWNVLKVAKYPEQFRSENYQSFAKKK